MTDGIIKGTGNSRYLRGPANIRTLYPTYDDLLDALAAGTLPIDLNGINPAGWDVVGNKLDKATLLTDALCTALGLAVTATPTQAMDKLRQLVATAQTGVDNGVKTQIVSYTGTGKYNYSYPTSITFSFVPKLAIMLGYTYKTDYEVYWAEIAYSSDSITHIVPETLTTAFQRYFGFSTNRIFSYGKKSSDGKTLSWYANAAHDQLNDLGYTYYFLGIS